MAPINKKEFKKLIIPFLIFYLLSFLILNWEDISWVFNYRFISATLSNFFEKEKIEKFSDFEFSEKENSLEIPKIEVVAPIVFSEAESEKDFEKALKQGVLFYPQSVLPGERGEVIILGHSVPPNWPKINYDWVFSRLNELNSGDEIFLYFEHQKYPYQVFEKIFLNSGQELPSLDLTNSKQVLTLLSCWPPGKDFQRIAVRAELQKP